MCETFAKRYGWNAVETPEILCILVSKLPGALRHRWNKRVFAIRQNFKKEPCLSDFTKLANEEIILVSDPIFSREAV